MENSLSKESQTFEQSLYKLYKDGKITLDEAMLNADSPTNLHWLVSHGQNQEEDEATAKPLSTHKGPDEGASISFDIDLIDTPR
jgi:twitching motility protein PilU